VTIGYLCRRWTGARESNKETGGGKRSCGKTQAAQRSSEDNREPKIDRRAHCCWQRKPRWNTSRRWQLSGIKAPSKIEQGRNPDASGKNERDRRTWAREEGSALTRTRAGKRNARYRNQAANKMSDKTLRRCRPQEF
jgi:hypothetical protein